MYHTSASLITADFNRSVLSCLRAVSASGELISIPLDFAISAYSLWYKSQISPRLSHNGQVPENADGEVPTSPAGLWAVLNFTYTPKSGNHDRMGSARALKVTYKTMAGFEEWASAFDNMTNEWTPAKAAEVVVLDSMRTMDEMREANDQIMKPVRDKLAMYELGAGTRTGERPVVSLLQVFLIIHCTITFFTLPYWASLM